MTARFQEIWWSFIDDMRPQSKDEYGVQLMLTDEKYLDLKTLLHDGNADSAQLMNAISSVFPVSFVVTIQVI